MSKLFSRKPTTPPTAWGTPTATPPTKPVTLTSKTELSPSPKSRTTIGVGERVEVTASEKGGTWTTTAGTLSATTGKKVSLTAPDSPGTSTVTVDIAGVTASISFTVIAPNAVNMVRLKGTHKKNGFPNATMVVRPHLGPATVNFGAVEMIEDDVAAVATGYWSDFNGVGHDPNTAWIGFTDKVVSGKGTAMAGSDNVGSGWVVKDPKPKDWTGRLSFDIPWRWKCGTGTGAIAIVHHVCATDAAGTTTMTKNGASYSAKLSLMRASSLAATVTIAVAVIAGPASSPPNHGGFAMSHAQAAPIEIAPPDPEVTAKLDEYERTRAPLALRQAADAAAAHDEEAAPDPALALRLARQRVSGWLAMLEVINADLDPAFDPDDPPATTVSPPPDAAGVQLPPGVSPSAVRDPVARQIYLDAIKNNSARLADFARAVKLAEAHDVILERAKPSLLDTHTTLGLPLDEIRALINQAGIRPADRTALLAALH